MTHKNKADETNGLEVIGYLRSIFREKFGTPRQPHLVPGATASITISPKFTPLHSLIGLEKFSHVWLLSYFHLNTNKKFLPKVHPPRLRGETIGLFASRSPHRPSPIGLSCVRLLRVEGSTLYFSGIDLVDGTPILDIKPYVPESDLMPNASSGWMGTSEFPQLEVQFSSQSLQNIDEAQKRLKIQGLKEILESILRQELRNPRDKSQSKDGAFLSFFIYDFELRFIVRDSTVKVASLVTGTTMKKMNPAKPVSAFIKA